MKKYKKESDRMEQLKYETEAILTSIKEEKQLFLTQKGNEHPLPKKEIDMAMEREL